MNQIILVRFKLHIEVNQITLFEKDKFRVHVQLV